jgi:hypothetical protein
MKPVFSLLNTLLILNAVFFAVNAWAIMQVNLGKGLTTSGAGLLAIMALGIILVMLCHLVCILIVLKTQNLPTLYVITVVSGALVIYNSVVLSNALSRERAEREHTEQQTRAREKYVAGEEVALNKSHKAFTMAIAANDSNAVSEMILRGEAVTAEDLKFAAELTFVYDRAISLSIFKNLIRHQTNVHFSDELIWTFLYTYSGRHECDPQRLKIIKLFISHEVRLLPDHSFPLVCKEVLALLFENGISVDALTTINYTNYEVADEINYFPRWTPVMIYANEFPNFFEETKMLLGLKANVDYEDENGYTLRKIIHKKLNESYSSAHDEMLRELLEISKSL